MPKLKKKKKPKFLRPNYGRTSRKRIKDNWRRPRGIDNKKRVKIAYMGSSPSIGYSQDRRIRGLHPSGKKEFLISNLQELKKIPANSALRIAATIGKKLRIKIEEEAKKLGFFILNPLKNKNLKKEKDESLPTAQTNPKKTTVEEK
ncbi:MAG: 50S ribosomal protein L32e [Candidatus Micrarchaeota archaeon]|nr:50S ribosomal protein L32e [Candidatus Micrarchaeota archaeon]